MKTIYSTCCAILLSLVNQNLAFSEAPFFMDDTVFGKFSKEDIKILKDNITKANELQAVNQPLEWKNIETGNGGTVTLLESLGKIKTTQNIERDCNRLQIENHTKEQKGNATFTFCRADDGSWKVFK